MRMDSDFYGLEIGEASNLLKRLGSNGFYEFGDSSIEFHLTIMF